MFRKVASLLACLLFAAAGCQDACLTLADQICSCQPDENSKANCNQQAKTAESTFAVTSADEQYCQSKLDLQQCDCGSQNSPAATAACCAKLNTPEGRDACGLVITSP
ncbi:MAG: hypothetical protein ABR567_11340 [Myxococcales bacterium]|nr:hypothetical protein [Myxococcales bacterium]